MMVRKSNDGEKVILEVFFLFFLFYMYFSFFCAPGLAGEMFFLML